MARVRSLQLALVMLLTAVALLMLSQPSDPVHPAVARARDRVGVAEDSCGVLTPVCCQDELDFARRRLTDLEEAAVELGAAQAHLEAVDRDDTAAMSAALDERARAEAGVAFVAHEVDEIVELAFEAHDSAVLRIAVVGGFFAVLTIVALVAHRRRRTVPTDPR